MSTRISTVIGTGIALHGNDVDTDRIIPARFVKALTFDGLGRHVFADDREMLAGLHPFDDPRRVGATILVAAKNFGCGSSREHAPQALLRHGIRAIVGESFGEIFRGNCGTIGLPCVTVDRSAAAELRALVTADPTVVITVDLPRLEVVTTSHTWQLTIAKSLRRRFLEGRWDTLAELLSVPLSVETAVRRVPYLNDWTAG